MSPVEAVLFWVTTALYAAGFIAMTAGAILRRPRWGEVALMSSAAGLAANTALVAVRWSITGHAPVGDRYELTITGVWIAMALVLAVVFVLPRMRPLLSGVLPVMILALGLAITSEQRIGPLSPAYDSPWLAVHVVFAFLSFGCFALAFGAGTLYLLEEAGSRHRLSYMLPPLDELDIFGYRMVALGFVLESVMIATGAVWANNLWGIYWSWDPVETWSLISLLVYALYLHLYAFRGWRGRRAAILAVGGLVFVIMCFWGVQLVAPTIHNFNRF